MEQSITQFIHSDGGLITAWVLIVLGLSDLASGYYMVNYRPDLIPLPANKLQALMTTLYFLSSFLVLTGIYMIYIRA